MPLSVTCQCGSRLEIDEKFLGKEIPCPDCQRPLPTKPPSTPPPLELPNNRRMSGFAILSFTLALVGFFVPPLSWTAIGVGIWALRKMGQRPGKLEGIGFARAGIGVGVLGTLVTTAALLSPTVFGIDVFLRELAMTSSIDYAAIDNTFSSESSVGDNVDIKRPSPAWGKYKGTNNNTPNQGQSNVLLMLVNVPEDAYIACLSVPLEGDEKPEERQKKVLEQLYKSDVVNIAGRLRGVPFSGKETLISEKAVPNSDYKEIIVDIHLPRIDRRALIHFTTREQNKASVMVAIARTSRFERLQKTFLDTFANIKFKQ